MKIFTLLFDSLCSNSLRTAANRNSCAEKNTITANKINKRFLVMPLMVLTILFSSGKVWGQSAGFNTSFVVLSLNGGANAYYDLLAATGNPDFQGSNLGSFAAASSNLILKGAEHNVYKCGTADLTSTRVYYRIYLTSAGASGSFISTTIGFSSGGSNGCGGQDQQWRDLTYSTNLLTGLAPGNYSIQVYSDATVTNCCGGTVTANNGGSFYTATFTVTGNYYSKSTGNLELTSSWGTNTNGTGNAPANFTTAGNTFNIRNNATPTIGAAWTVSGSGSKVIVGDGTNACTLTLPSTSIYNSVATDVSNNATVRFQNTTAPTFGTTNFLAGSVYEHNLGSSGGTIPTATWNSTSTCRLKYTATSSSSPSGLAQTFGKFEIDCGSQTSNNVVITPTNVTNEFRVTNTGTGSFQLQSLVIDGNYIQTGGTIKVMNSTGTATANIKGSYTLNGGAFTISDANGSANAVNLIIDGACNLTSGTFSFQTNSSSGLAYFQLKGTTTISSGIAFAGVLQAVASTNSGFYFNRATAGTISLNVSVPTSGWASIRTAFFYNTTNVTGINETYNGLAAQTTVDGTIGGPGAGYATWPTSGTVIKTVTISNTAGVTASIAKVINTSLVVDASCRYDIGANAHTIASGATGTINGTLRSAATITTNSNLTFSSTGTYEHNFTTASGSIPTATWTNPGSTCKIIGFTSYAGPMTSANGWGQSFSNFEWACSGQTASTNWQLNATTAPTINGNFIISNTNTAPNGLRLSSSGTYTLNVTGDFQINSTNGNAKIDMSNGGTGTINVGGNVTITQPANTATLLLSSGTGTVIFNKNASSPVQQFSSAGTITGSVNWNVGTGSTPNIVQLISNVNLGTGTGTFTAANTASVDFQTFVLSGSGTFSATTGTTLISANTSASGAINTSGANGSVQTTTRTFTNAGVNYTFNGASAQFTGNAIGAASNIQNLTFNTTGSLTLSSAATLSATGVLAFGTNATTFILGANDLTLTSGATISGAGSTKYVRTASTGQLKRTALTTAFTFPVGNSAYNPITLTNTGTSDTYGIIASDGTVPNALDATKAVNRYWAVTEGTGGGGNLAVTAQFNTADGFGASYTTSANQFIGLYPNASPWTQNGSGAAASGSNPYTVTASGFTNTLPTSGSTYYFAVGNTGAFVAPPVAPTITSFAVASPGSGSSGYVGNTITVTGTGFLASGMTVKIGGSGGTTVSYSFTNSTTITIAAINLSGTIYIDNGTAPAATSSASYTNLGYITTTGATNWNTAASWLGGAVPVANSDVTIAHALSIAAAFTNTPIASITVNTGITLTASATVAIGTVTNAITTNGTGIFTFTGAGGSIIAGSVVNAGTLSWSAAATLNISASGTLTNNGTFTRGTGTVTIVNAATINGSGAITFNNLTITSGTATLTTVPTIDGTLTITSGGVSAAPIYTTNSTLNYNGVSVRSTEWNATGVGTIGTTAGYPNNVTISTGTVDIVNGANTARALNGTLTVNTGATFNLNALNAALTIGGGLTTVGTGTFSMGSTNAAVTVAGAVSNAGTLTLASTSGGNLNVAGNWTNTGTFTPNSRTVTFNGTAAGQTINNATTFFAVVIDNTNAAGVLVATSNNLTVTNSLVVNASRLLDINAGIVHTGSTFTVNGTLRISAGGFVQNASPAPVYGAASTLIYNATTYGRSNEWNATGVGTIGTTAGYPNNVTINTGIFDIVNGSSTARAMNGTLTVNTGATFNVNALNAALTIGGDLTTVGTGTFSMGSTNAGVTVAGTLTNAGTVTLSTATASLTVSGAVSNSGALTLSSNIGGDIYVTGNFTNNGTFTHSNRALFLNGTTQTLGGSNINGSGATNCFPFLLLQNGTNVTLAASAAVTNTLTLTSGKITLSSFDLNIGASAISGASASNYIVTNSTGQLKRTVTSSAVTFPVGNSAYNPITFTNAGTSDTYGIRVVDGAPTNALDALVTVQRSWYITEAVAGGSDLTPVVAQYNSGEVGSNYNAGTTPYMGLYNGTAWSQVATTLGGSITATSTGTAQFPATIPAGSYIAIGKDGGLASTPPSITSFSATSGYSGSSIVITGTNFTGATAVSFGGTAAASFTVDNANQITAVVGTGGTSGSVSVITPSGSTSLAGFTYLGFITTSGASNWNTGASWLGGAVPTANTAVTIAHNLSIAAAFTNSPISSITVNTGITATASATVAIGTVTNAITTSGSGVFTFSGAGGSIIAGSVVNGGTLSWSAAATLNISAAGTLTNNGTFTRGAGTVTILNAATINGTNAITFNNLTITTGTTTLTTVPTIDGTLQLNGGDVSAAPIYTSNSTLYYNLAYSRFSEWNATGVGTIGTTAGYPNNVTINTGTFDIVNGSNTARAMNGTLTINTGATFNVNALNAAVTIGGGLTTVGTGAFNMGTTNAAVSVAGAVTNAGSLTLSSVSGGDIYVAGNFSNNGTFTHNTRAVFLNGTTQTVSGSALNTSGTTNCFDFLFIQNNSQVTLGAAVTVRSNLTFTSGDIILSTFNFTLTSGATITGASNANYFITNNTGLLVRTLATSTAVTFPIGNSAYNPITISQSGASDVYSLRMIDGSLSGLSPNDVTRTIDRRWSATRTSSSNVNITVSSISYNTGEENNATNFNGGTQPYYGLYNGTSWVQATATQAAQTFTSSNTVASSTATSFSVAMGKDLAFLPAAPTVTSVDVASGYSGSTIVITGSDFTGATAVSFGGTAAASFTVNNATQITAVVGTGGASGSVSVTTPSGSGSLAGFNYLGFITTSGATIWNTASSWLGGVVPTINNAVTIAHNLSIAAAFTNTPIASVTVNTGITATASATVAIGTVTNAITTSGTGVFTFSGAGGSIIAGSFVNGGTLSWSAAATLNISASGTLTNNGTFTRGTGTVAFANAGTVNGSGAITFNNLTLTSGVLALSTTPTIAGTFALNGGNISTNAPIYTNTSTLQYGATYSRFLEWSATGIGTIGTTQGYPNNVTISSGTFTVVNSDAGTARALAGNVQVNTGCTFTTGALNAVLTIGGNLTTTGTGNFNMSTTNAAVTVVGSVSTAGTLALSSTAGGDLNVGGDWTRTGTFTHNSRAVTFNGTVAQTINSATTFAFLTITNSSADVTAAAAITVTSNLTINGSATLTRLNMQANTLTLTGATSTITSGFLRSAVSITTGTNTFGANGTYEHNLNAGTIITATWNSGSTCAIIGCTATTPSGGLGQSFHHFTWNCSSQSTTVNIVGALTTVNGNFSVINTNAGTSGLRLANGAYTLAIGGDLIVSAANGITSRLDLNGATGSGVINLSGNLLLTTAGTGVATILKTGGTQAINFVKSSGTQTITQSGGTFAAAQTININIGNGTSTNTVQLASNVNLGTGTGTFTVLGNATFDAGTYVLSGSAASTFNSGANIITANTGGVNGSVTLSGTRTYNAAANYTFNNSDPTAQVTGAAVTAANNITLNNSAGVSLSAGTTVSGALILTSGKLTIGANTLTLNGTVASMSASNSLVGSSTSNLTIGGIGSLGTLFFDQTTSGTTNLINNFIINRTSSGSAALGNNLNIDGTLTFTNGNLDLNGSNNITLGSTATITGENCTKQFTNSVGATQGNGYVQTTRTLAANPGNIANLGLNVQTATSLGSTNIKRFVQKSVTTPSGTNTIKRVYSITPAAAATGNVTLTSSYCDGELNGNSESSPVLIIYYGSGTNETTGYSNVYATASNDAGANTVTTGTTGSLIAGQNNFTLANAGTDAYYTVANTDWNTGSTWILGTVPPTTATVTIKNAVSVGTDATAGSVNIDSGKSVTVASGADLTVTNAIVNNGTLTIENNGNLMQTNNDSNSGSGSTVVKRNSSLLKRLDYTLWSSPVTGQGVYDFSKYTFPGRFYVYDEEFNNYNNAQVGLNVTNLQYPPPLTSSQPAFGVNGTDVADETGVKFAAGKGYLIRVPYDHPTAPTVYPGVFTGTANNGNISATVSSNSSPTRGYNAVGNPYPSRLNVHNFIDGNTNIDGTLYLWRKTNNAAASTSYATLTKSIYTANGAAGGDTGTGFFPTGSGQEANWVLNIGQGFIVKADSGTSVSFTNSMRRSLNADQFFRNSQTTTSINGVYWLNLIDNTGVYSQMAVGYNPEGTLGFDRGYDGKNINKEFYLTSLIDAEDYTIQTRPDFDSSDIVPLSYKAITAGNYSIAIDHLDGLFTDVSQPIYVKDNLTTTYHDLHSSAYNFASDAGTFTNRFEIVYALPLGIENPVFTANNVIIYNQNNEFVVNAGNTIMSSIKVFDIRGRLLQEKTSINASQTTIGSGLANQVLLVQITSEDGATVTKKVVR